MNEYSGKSVKSYRQPSDKFYSLFPALDRNIPTASNGQTLLDLGCGTGDLYQFILEKGYGYIGIDISKDMIAEAKNRFPDADLRISSASEIYKTTKQKFDVIMANMLFPSLTSTELFDSVFASMSRALKTDGLVVIGTMNPYFDGYMQKWLFARDDIETKFVGYFHSGVNYVAHREINGETFDFSDYHWQLPDYVKSANKYGLKIKVIDDCEPQKDLTKDIPQKKFDIPNYMVLVLG